jgi:hypothetical protein
MILQSPTPPPDSLIRPENLPVARLRGCFVAFKELADVRYHSEPTQKPRAVLIPVYGLLVQGVPRFLVDRGMTASLAQGAKLVAYLACLLGGPVPKVFNTRDLIGEPITIIIAMKTVVRDGKPSDRRWKHIEAIVLEPFPTPGEFPPYDLFEDAWRRVESAGVIGSDLWSPA